MKKNISDASGRSLEYAIVECLSKKVPQLLLLGSTLTDQQREVSKYMSLPAHQQKLYIKASESIFNWLEDEMPISTASTLSLERLSDAKAKKGDVTDIRITCDSEVKNLSIKHNHMALKHQRPASLAQQCGFSKGSKEDLSYRAHYGKITSSFLQKAAKCFPGEPSFNSIKEIDANFINVELYTPVCNLTSSFLNTNCGDNAHAQHFFSFLVGMTDYFKLVVFPDHIEIMKFADLPPVSGLKAFLVQSSYVNVDFSNGWDISMRIHSASTKIDGVSLKWDTQPRNITVPTYIKKL